MRIWTGAGNLGTAASQNNWIAEQGQRQYESIVLSLLLNLRKVNIMKELENGEYVLTMKENKCILNSITDRRVIYYPNKEYRLGVKNGVYRYFNEIDDGTLEYLYSENFLNNFNIKKVVWIATLKRWCYENKTIW